MNDTEIIKSLTQPLKVQEHEFSSMTDYQAIALRGKASKLSMLTPERHASAVKTLRRWIDKQGLNKRDVTSVVGARVAATLVLDHGMG
jgi:hypothetical protein